MRKVFLVLVVLFSLIIISKAFADGIIFSPKPPYNLIEENYQLAAINHDKGIQKMIIAVNINMKNTSEAVWIFPVPAKPEKVVIDIVSHFPSFYGTEVKRSAKYNIEETIYLVGITQIYPFFLSILYPRHPYTLEETMGDFRDLVSREGITIHEHIGKEGVVAELITSKNAEALYNYLTEKGLNINRDSIKVLDHYIGKEYTFVIAWASKNYSDEIYGGYSKERYYNQPGLFVAFPTEKIYYPLLPTSVYGSKKIPIRLYVISTVTPDLYSGIEPYSDVEYYSMETQYLLRSYLVRSYYEYEEYNTYLKLIGEKIPEKLKYTKIEIYAPSKFLTEDLWISKKVPMKISYAYFLYSITSNPLVELLIIVVTIILISALSGAIAGFVTFRDVKKYVLVSLLNIFSLIALCIGILFVRTTKLDEKLEKQIKEAKLRVFDLNIKKLLFVVIFSITYILLSFFLKFLILLPLKI